MQQETITKLSQCLWCGSKDVDFLHQQFILPICPKCFDNLKKE